MLASLRRFTSRPRFQVCVKCQSPNQGFSHSFHVNNRRIVGVWRALDGDIATHSLSIDNAHPIGLRISLQGLKGKSWKTQPWHCVIQILNQTCGNGPKPVVRSPLLQDHFQRH